MNAGGVVQDSIPSSPEELAWDWAVIGDLRADRRALVERVRTALPAHLRGVVASGRSTADALEIGRRSRVTIELPGDAAVSVHLRREVPLAGGVLLEHVPDGSAGPLSYSSLDELVARVCALCADPAAREAARREARSRLDHEDTARPFSARRVSVGDLDLWLRTEHTGDWDVAREVVLQDMYGLRSLERRAVTSIVDVGAHIGAFMSFAKRLWPGAACVAVEPNPRSCELLGHNVGRLPDMRVVEAAVRYDGAAVLTASLAATGGGFVTHDDLVEATLRPNGRDRLWDCRVVGRVTTVTLEELVPSGPIDLLKLDCEGSELDIVARASDELLSRVGILLGEFHDESGSDRFEALLRRRLPRHEVRIERGRSIGLFTCLPPGGP